MLLGFIPLFVFLFSKFIVLIIVWQQGRVWNVPLETFIQLMTVMQTLTFPGAFMTKVLVGTHAMEDICGSGEVA